MSKPPDADGPETPSGTLGTFAGVFTPSILTILGIILFLRLAFVVGQAGLARALVIIAVANAISVLTSLSLAAIATNLRVRGGGDYYLISRTLGPEFGGAIGIVLFLAQAVSVAFYCIGFGEAVAPLLPLTLRGLPQMVAALAAGLLFCFAWLGADWATRFQYGVMAILGLALAAFFVGGLRQWDGQLLVQNWAAPAGGAGFWVLFAIFFPAVTGFTQGVSMSGDLRDAGRSLPLGTFAAVGLSILVYFAAAVVLAAALPAEVMRQDYGAMNRVALFGVLITAGVIAATLSSAMASFLGAPRILQSLAGDRLFGFLRPFAEGSGPSGNPRRGVLLTAGVAFATIGLGRLNLIAPVVSMFFLISYGLLNMATYYEARGASPSFRPRFRWYDYRLSLLGGLACLVAMLAIDWAAGAIAGAVLFGVYQYLQRTAGPARWADSRRSYYLQRLRENLWAAAGEPEHPRNWRPFLLAFSEDPAHRRQLMRFAGWLEGRSGMTSVVRVLEGQGLKVLRERDKAEAELQADIQSSGIAAFPLVVAAPELNLAVHILVQAYGLGPVRANTVLVNWFDRVHSRRGLRQQRRFGRHLRTAFRLGCNLIVLHAAEGAWEQGASADELRRRIAVWWQGDATGQLMLLLAHLITRSSEWEGARIGVLAPMGPEGPAASEAELHRVLTEVRIEAEAEVVEAADGDALARRLQEADLVLLPFRFEGDQPLGPFDETFDAVFSRLPATAMVRAAEDIDLDAAPEEGELAEQVAVLDDLDAARSRADKMTRSVQEAAAEAEKMQQEYEAVLARPGDSRSLEEIRDSVRQTRARAEEAERRAAKARAKLDDALRRAEALGLAVRPEEEENTPTDSDSQS